MTELTKVVRSAYQQLADLGYNYWGTSQSEEDTRFRCAQGTCLVAEDEGRLIATVVVKNDEGDDSPEWYRRDGVMVVTQFGVVPELQGKGIGSLLVAECEKTAFEEDADELALDTAEGETHLIDFYAKRGYRQVGRYDYNGTNYLSVVMSKRLRPVLATQRLVLREPVEKDRKQIQEYWSDERFKAYYPPDRLSPEHCDETVDESLAAMTKYPRLSHHWAITFDGELIGRVRLELSKRNSAGHLGYEFAPDHWGKGFATEAVKEVVRYGFEELRLHSVHAWVYEPNKASQNVLGKAGFTHQGALRKRCSWGDDWVDDMIFGILDEEWSGDPPLPYPKGEGGSAKEVSSGDFDADRG